MALEELTNMDPSYRRPSDDMTNLMSTRLHRKESSRRLHSYSDSSRSRGSSIESIYNAPCCDHDEFSRKDTQYQTPIPPVMSGAIRENQNIHIPHKLETIIEQKSIATLRQSTSLTLRQKASVISQLSNKTPIGTLRARAKLRRRLSFSVNDITAYQAFRRFLRQSISTTSSSPGNSFEVIRSYPVQPFRDPPIRIPTPEGLPTFNTPEAAAYRLSPPPRRIRNFWRCQLGGQAQWRRQTVGLPRGAVMRGDGFLVRSTFRKPHSAHTFVPASNPGQNVDDNGFPTRRTRHNTRTSSTAAEGYHRRVNDSNTSEIYMVPGTVPKQLSRQTSSKTPIRKSSLLLCCCCAQNKTHQEGNETQVETTQLENEDLEALRAIIRSDRTVS